MLRYALRRIILIIPIILAVATLIFFLVRLVPGDPAIAVLGDYASAEAMESFRERLGLNQSLGTQYLQFISGIMRGDFGVSMVNFRPISSELRGVIPYTIELTFSGILLGVLVGVPLGIWTALNQNKWPDYLGRVTSLFGLSIPAFYLGILLLLLFAIKVPLFPVISSGGLGLGSRLRELVLPAATIGMIMTAYVTRITRSSLLEVMSEDYIRTAKAKGLPYGKVVFKHLLRNGLIPVVTVVGLYASSLMGSSVMTEIVFNRPGLGKLIVGAMQQRDYNMLQSVIMVYAIIVVVLNLLTDLSYGLIDPRIRYE